MPKLLECHAFIACSLDGFIARPDGDIAWLTSLPVPEGEDFGYAAFVAGMDAILMGRGSYEKVLTFPSWPYQLPVTVLSGTLPPGPAAHATITDAPLVPALERLAASGARRVYADGGKVISALLREGFLTRMVVTRVPVLLGAGLPLFAGTGEIGLTLEEVRHWPNGFVQSAYRPEP